MYLTSKYTHVILDNYSNYTLSMNIESHSLDDLLQEVDNDSFYDSQHETERFKEIIEKLTLRN